MSVGILGHLSILSVSAFMLESPYGTSNVDVAIDTLGRRHVAFSEWNGDAVYYGTCRTDCGSATGWQFVRVFDSGVEFGNVPSEVQIEIDSQDRPRIGFEVQGYGVASEGYFYAECNSDCLSPTGWRVLNFAEANRSTVSSSEWFAVAADDSVHAVTLFTEEGFLNDQHVYIHYSVCDEGCTSAANWRSVSIVYLGNLGFLAPVVNLSFGIDAERRPRLAVWVSSDSGQGAIYFECSADCEDPANWQSIDVTGAWGAALALALDADGRPHVAASGTQSIRYLWCEDRCLIPDSWMGVEFTGLPGGAGSAGVGLTMDAQGHPHIGYATAGGRSTGYLACASGCASPNTAEWQNRILESADFPRYPQYPGCVAPIDQAWTLNGPISVAVDTDGSALLGYTAANIQRSYCLDSTRVADVAVRLGRIAFAAPDEGTGGADAGVADAETEDAGRVDGGTVQRGTDADVETRIDAGESVPDAGASGEATVPSGEDGCQCMATERSMSGGWALLAILVLASVRPRRQTAPDTRSSRPPD